MTPKKELKTQSKVDETVASISSMTHHSEKISELKKRIESGSYQIDEKAIIDGILKKYSTLQYIKK